MLRQPYPAIGAVLLAFVIAAVVVRIAHAILRRVLDRLDIGSGENRAVVNARAKQLLHALELLAFGVAVLASLSLGLERFGIVELRWHPRQLTHWALTQGVNIVIIVVSAFIVVRAANLAVEHLLHRLGRRQAQGDLEWQRRAATLGGILTSFLTGSIAFVAVLMVLRELTIDVVPILTGAGIAGLAIGLGAQSLVRDVISGFFLILEDQVRVGDLARVNGVEGTIEQISLRTVVLRDNEGAVQVFPNGTITALANLSKQYAYAIVDARVAYNENLDLVLRTIREVGEAMERDDVWRALVLAPIEIVGVESLANGSATIRVKFKTLPLQQGKVANEVRRQLMTTFAARGIRPYAG